jgi:predicted ester cyclase
MSVEENKAIIIRLVESLNNEEWDIFNELMSPDLVDQTAQATDRESFRQWANIFRYAFSDIRRKIIHIFGEDDKVCIYLEITATHSGEFRGIAPTGEKIKVYSMLIWRVVDGLITERIQVTESVDYLMQIGVIDYTEDGRKLL